MDTPALTRLPAASDRSITKSRQSGGRRRLRLGGIVALMLMMQGTAAYLLTWIDPPRAALVCTLDFSRAPPLPPRRLACRT